MSSTKKQIKSTNSNPKLKKGISGQKKHFPFLAAILLLTLIAYYPALQNDFLHSWDDHEYVLNNADVKSLNATTIQKNFTSFYIGNYQPLTILSYAIDHKLFGLSGKAFHGMNLFFHLLSTYLVFAFAFKLSSKIETAVVTAAVFALHPTHVESVAWIAERKDVLYGLFFIASMHTYLYYILNQRQMKFYLISFVFFLFSCLSKSAAVTLPLVLLLIDYYHFGKINLKNILNKLPFLALSITFGIIALISQKSAGATTMAPDYPIFERFFLVNYSILFYVVKAFIPLGLSAMYYYPEKINNLLPWYYYAAPLINIGIIIFIVKANKLKKELIFGSLFLLITLSLILQVIPLGRTITADRYTYIPYIGIGFMLGQLYIYVKERKLQTKSNAKIILYYTFFIYLIFFNVSTWQRSKIWKDDITLFTDVIEKHPEQAHPYLVRAAARMDIKDYKNAMTDYNKGIELDSSYAEAWNNRGNVSYNLKDYKTATKDYSKAIELDPKYPLPYNNRGSCKKNLQDYEGALVDFSKAIEFDPKFFVAYHNRGLTRYELKDYKGALDDYAKTIEFKPDYPDAYSNRGVAKYYLQDYAGALIDYNKAIELNPNYGEAFSNRAAAKFYLNNMKGACEDWNKALQLGYSSAKEMLGAYCK